MTLTPFRLAPGHSPTLTTEAQAWLAGLPAPVRVHGVAAHEPELANRIAAAWTDLRATAELLENILVEMVRAMPDVIVAELLRLYEYVLGRCGQASSRWPLPAMPVAGDEPRRTA